MSFRRAKARGTNTIQKSVVRSAAAEARFEQLQIAWVNAHEGGSPCFTDPLLVASVSNSLNFLDNGLREAAAKAGVPAVALLPKSSTCALATSLCFPPEGGLAIDTDVALASNFFAPGGPVCSALPDFLRNQSATGRQKLAPARLHEVFLPRADSWLQLSAQAACFVEQVAWLLLEQVDTPSAEINDEAPAEGESKGEAEAAVLPEVDSVASDLFTSPDDETKNVPLTRRQRQKAAARRRIAEAAEAAEAAEEAERAVKCLDGAPIAAVGEAATATATTTASTTTATTTTTTTAATTATAATTNISIAQKSFMLETRHLNTMSI
eukprot:TRINITY_DN22714_c2_g2_i2.p1 TRINITY_DN22714_c2_g2~~TRINITY_DN22714_c2_g2_i2.p1  ORF type:complete len:340 (+),score=100.36 TRINITY_DN22714_c2_g2_i2:49-1020(+)